MIGRAHFILSWSLLAFERRRLLAAVAGVAFAVVLILVQIGFYGAMISSATKVHRSLNADLVMVPADFEYFGSVHSFARVRLMQAAGVDSVAAVTPFYVTLMNFRNIDNGYDRSILAIGVDPGQRVLALPDVLAEEGQLGIAGNVLFDRRGLAAYFGDVAGRFEASGPLRTMIEGHPVTVAGLFDLGTSFIAFGTAIMGTETYFALRADQQPDLPSFGLIRLKPGADPAVEARRISALLDAPDVLIETRAQFIQQEVDYWNTTAELGFIFITGALMGIFVGAVIVYQILYTDVTDHLPEYATLKAMGYPAEFFRRVVLEQSVMLSVLGFIPGTAISLVIYAGTRAETGYAMTLTPGNAVMVLAVTVGMCITAGLLAMRRLRRADPADLFR